MELLLSGCLRLACRLFPNRNGGAIGVLLFMGIVVGLPIAAVLVGHAVGVLPISCGKECD